uniref:Uncharacterized protein LOC111114145 n=1 Tax=Crassostrea virginica TaxID=6565 RepID=A0A8B8BXN2_CRAVI|nr:uncharacterized protein LOC111114145 [Crassostrea virginica]
MIDFEQGAWKAIQRTFPDVTIQGCCFHWTQAVWRRIQEIGLAPTCMKREATHQYIKQLMTLPFLPLDDIPSAFHTLTIKANTAELRALVNYMDHQWIRNPLFQPSAWSVYRLPVRTNNDVEGNLRSDMISEVMEKRRKKQRALYRFLRENAEIEKQSRDEELIDGP